MFVVPLRRTEQPGTIAELAELLAAQSDETGRLRERLWAEERAKASLQAELSEVRSEKQQLANDLQTAIESLRLALSISTKEQHEKFESTVYPTVPGEQRRRMIHLGARFGLRHPRLGNTGNLASSAPQTNMSAPGAQSRDPEDGRAIVDLPEDRGASSGENHWEVVGGKRDGILVRIGHDLNSDEAQPSRLHFGALVKQVQLLGVRLHFKLVSGHGPLKGWVSIRHSGKRLLVRKALDDKSTGHENNSHKAPELLLESSTSVVDASDVDVADAAGNANEADAKDLFSSASPPGTPKNRPSTAMAESSPVDTEHFVMSPEKKRKIGPGEVSAASSPPSSWCSSDMDPEEPELEENCCAPSLHENSEDQLEVSSEQHLRFAPPPVSLLYESGPQAEVKVLRRIVQDLEQQLTQAQAQLDLLAQARHSI